MKQIIGERVIELLDLSPDDERLPPGQAAAYRLLKALGEGQHSEAVIMKQLGLRSPLPLWSRLEHLQERGLIRVLAAVAAE